MTVRKFNQPDSSTQVGQPYKTAIDDSISVLAQTAQDFAPHAKDVPDLTALVDAGVMLVQGSQVSQAQQTVSGFVATGANQRIDRIVVNMVTGAASRVAGSEAASPVAPAVPTGFLPCAQVGPFTTGTTSVTNLMITDERVSVVLQSSKNVVDLDRVIRRGRLYAAQNLV